MSDKLSGLRLANVTNQYLRIYRLVMLVFLDNKVCILFQKQDVWMSINSLDSAFGLVQFPVEKAINNFRNGFSR